MERKKWTAKDNITDEVLKFREKRKWQVALRRYVLEKNKSTGYAYYFGLDIEKFRMWIEIQFTNDLNWQNFGAAWQFEHVLPVSYFDFTSEEELKLCWNFINIRVEKLEPGIEKEKRIDIIAVKPYFASLYNKTGHQLCLSYIEKIDRMIANSILPDTDIENFLIQNENHLNILASLNKDEFNSLNAGMSPQDILLEREILKRFG